MRGVRPWVFGVVMAAGWVVASNDLEYALQLYREGAWDLANQTFEAIVAGSRDPAVRETAGYYAILCRYQMGDYDQARAMVYLYLRERPFTGYRVPLMLLLGDLDRAQGKLTAALRQYMKVVRRYPRSPEAWTARVRTAEVYEELDRREEALEIYGRMLGEEGDAGRKAELRFRIAALMTAEGRWADAQEQYRNIILESSDPAVLGRAHYESGAAYLKVAEWEEARRRFERLLSLYPDHPLASDARYSLGWALEQKGDDAAALAAYGGLSNARPELRLNGGYRTAVLLGRAGRVAEAERILAALATNRISPALAEESRRQRVLMLAAAGRRNEAMALLSSVTDRMFVLRVSAELRYAEGDWQGALERFRPYVEAGAPGMRMDEAVFFLGVLQEAAGHEEEALETYRTVYRSYPASSLVAEAFLRSGRLLERRGRWDEALVAYNRVLALVGVGGMADRARAGVAGVYMRRGRLREAADLYAALARTAVSNAGRYWFEAGRAELGLGRKDAAVAMFQKVFESAGSTPEERAEAFQELVGLRGNAPGFVSFVSQVWPLLPEGRVRDEAVMALLSAALREVGARRFVAVADGWIPRMVTPDLACRARMMRASALREAGEAGRAAEAFGEVRSLCRGHPQEREAVYGMMVLALESGEAGRAERLLEELVRMAPRDPMSAEAVFEMGRYWFRNRDPVRSRRWFRLVEWDFPESEWTPRAVYWTGLALVQEGNLTNAAAAFEKVFTRYPESDVADAALFRAAEAYRRLGRHAQAVLWYRRLLEAYPRSSFVASARAGLAESLAQLGNRQAAEAVQREMGMAGRGEEALRARLEFARLLMSEAEYGQAVEVLSELERQNYRPSEVGLLLGHAYRLAGDCASARPRYSRVVLAEGAEMAEALYHLGLCSETENDLKTARDYYGRVARLFPGSVWASRAELKLSRMGGR